MELRQAEFFLVPENPLPAGAQPGWIQAADGVKLRVARWTASAAARGTVALLPGYGEFIEKYFEVIDELRSRQFDVVIMDWRGHGLSDRLLADYRKGHVDDFAHYQRDLQALCSQLLIPFCRRPWYALVHSMGAANLLAQAHLGHSPFERIVLSAPMIDLVDFERSGARALIEALDLFGFGGWRIPGGRKAPSALRPFEVNRLTSDRRRFARTTAILRAAPRLGLGDPTIGWAHAAARLTHQFKHIDYARRITTPILVVAAGSDALIPAAATELFASRLKIGGLVTIPYARHEILMERDLYRRQFWAAFDTFIPGEQDAFARRLLEARAESSAAASR